MRRNRVRATIGVVVLVIGVASGALSGRSAGAQAPAGAAADPLIAEVRGLRAEIKQLAGTSIRTQLLVARLQLQEQRITALSRQQFDTREQLADADKRRADAEAALKMFGVKEQGVPPDEIKNVLRMMQAETTSLQQRASDLRSHEAELAAAVAAEQARWLDFNNRLDDVERELARQP